MTIDELIERLENYRDDLGGDTEVRLMTQPNWPFEHTIHGLTASDDDDAEPVVYICEGTQLGYGNKRAWDTAG